MSTTATTFSGRLSLPLTGLMGVLVGFAIGLEYARRTAPAAPPPQRIRELTPPEYAVPTECAKPEDTTREPTEALPVSPPPVQAPPVDDRTDPPVEPATTHESVDQPPAPLPPSDPGPRSEPSADTHRCRATTRAGTRCKRKARPPGAYCWQHQDRQ